MNKNQNRSIDEVQNLRKKEGTYAKNHAKIQVSGFFCKICGEAFSPSL